MKPAFVVGIVGAESTGKSTLALALHDAYARRGESVARVGEALREFCDREGRTPRREEQRALAGLQQQRIDEAARGHALVLADTTPLMTAIYSELVFGDRSLFTDTLHMHAGCSLTLLTALDLPWVADGLQRDGEQVRRPVDALLRAALHGHGISFSVVGGHGAARAAAAMAAIDAARRDTPPAGAGLAAARWSWVCERCGDPGCERHLLARG